MWRRKSVRMRLWRKLRMRILVTRMRRREKLRKRLRMGVLRMAGLRLQVEAVLLALLLQQEEQ